MEYYTEFVREFVVQYSREVPSHENLLKSLCERAFDESDFITENTDEEQNGS